MAEIILSQAEADDLIRMEKHRVNDDRHSFPWTGESLTVPLQSEDGREKFLLDISRGRIDLLRGKYQNRAQQIIALVRLDIGGPPHRNPDNEEIPCPHLHLYREGYGDKWAMLVPVDQFARTNDLLGTLQDFMTFCNVIEPPFIEGGLFHA